MKKIFFKDSKLFGSEILQREGFPKICVGSVSDEATSSFVLGTYEFSIGDSLEGYSITSMNNLEKFPWTNSVPVCNQS